MDKNPNRPDYEKLRRFALLVGLILMSYGLTGIALKSATDISLFGIPLTISRPQLIPAVLFVASLYGVIRFCYYGLFTTKSPYAKRRDLMNRLVHHVELDDGFSYLKLRSFGMYFGPTEFELGAERPWMYKRNRKAGESESAHETPCAWETTLDTQGNPIMPVEGIEFQNALEYHFPVFAGARVTTRWNYESTSKPMLVRMSVIIPKRCRLATFLEDLDYLAPIWVSLLSYAIYVWSLWG